MTDPMSRDARRQANARFLKARDEHVAAEVERDIAGRKYDAAVESLRSRTVYLERKAAEKRAAFDALPDDLKDIYREGAP